MPCASVSENPTRVKAENLNGGFLSVGLPRFTLPSYSGRPLAPFRRFGTLRAPIPGDMRGEVLMKRCMLLGCALVVALALSGTASAAVKSRISLDFYRATVSTEVYGKLLAKGIDIAAAEDVAGGVRP